MYEYVQLIFCKNYSSTNTEVDPRLKLLALKSINFVEKFETQIFILLYQLISSTLRLFYVHTYKHTTPSISVN